MNAGSGYNASGSSFLDKIVDLPTGWDVKFVIDGEVGTTTNLVSAFGGNDTVDVEGPSIGPCAYGPSGPDGCWLFGWMV